MEEIEKKESNENNKNPKEEVQEECSLEELFQKLDSIVDKMEAGKPALDESFHLYQQGMELLKQCNSKIDFVEKQVLILEKNGELHEF